MARIVRLLLIAALSLAALAAEPAVAGDSDIRLFKVVTVKDEIIVGMSEGELAGLGRTGAQALPGAEALAGRLAAKGELGIWRFAVRKNAAGALEYAPLHRVGLLRADSLRVEPYATPLPIVAPK
ncbi:MAG TPA: hypothetical protein VLA00_15295 [Xanthobacteraceae bacterium]|nr:hypothetical protein [Xanthobacteraceae bacterium]